MPGGRAGGAGKPREGQGPGGPGGAERGEGSGQDPPRGQGLQRLNVILGHGGPRTGLPSAGPSGGPGRGAGGSERPGEAVLTRTGDEAWPRWSMGGRAPKAGLCQLGPLRPPPVPAAPHSGRAGRRSCSSSLRLPALLGSSGGAGLPGAPQQGAENRCGAWRGTGCRPRVRLRAGPALLTSRAGPGPAAPGRGSLLIATSVGPGSGLDPGSKLSSWRFISTAR